ncbi:MAG: sensor hybrid histidine kinase [Gammaproteobacteria bacterium]|nr:sensor hybrid histidine kinase [Gammaproteobacteria bacterium]
MLHPPRHPLWILAFTCALVAILAVGFVSYTEMSVLASSNARVQRSYDVLQTLHDLNTALTDTETNQRGFLLTQDASYLDQYDAAIAQIRLALTELRRLSTNERTTEDAIGHLAQLAGAKLDEMQHAIHSWEKGQRHGALAQLAAGTGRQIMDDFRRNTLQLEADQRQLLHGQRQREYHARLASEAVLVATILLSLFFVGAATLVSRRFDERRRWLEREIAERQRSEERREALLTSERAARSEAERATRLKDEFVATMSHELRTPLNAIVGWASILRRDRRPDTVGQGVEVIERNAKLQARMVEDLLDMSRILSGKLAMDLQRMDLSLVIEAAIAAVRPAADAKGLRLQTTIQPTRSVTGDSGRLQQVVWNLLTNAIKFTPDRGTIAILVHEVESEGAPSVEISVRDSGQGIDPKFLPFVFDRFRQADASTTRRHGGLGLGLSIVKSLVEMHGGTVDVQSLGEGQGTTFTVRLPLALSNAHAAADTPAGIPRRQSMEEPSALAGLRVLVVDDEVDARTLARRVLEECGAEVVTVSSAADALAALAGESGVSVVVSDIGMPERDGYDLITQMRAMPGSAGRIPAIALTALARDEDRKHALLAGYQVHLSKPVDPAELVAVIGTLAGPERHASPRSPSEAIPPLVGHAPGNSIESPPS